MFLSWHGAIFQFSPLLFSQEIPLIQVGSELEKRLEKVEKECLQKAQDFRCEFRERSEKIYQIDRPGKWEKAMEQVASLGLNILTGFTPYLYQKTRKWIIKPGGRNKCFIQSQAVKDYNQFMASLTDFGEIHPLTFCQKACLSMCLTSHLLVYEDKCTFTDGSRITIFKKGRGGCKEYAHLAQHIAKAIGVPLSRVHSDSHAFVEILFPEGLYSYDPQDQPAGGTCRFFRYKK